MGIISFIEIKKSLRKFFRL